MKLKNEHYEQCFEFKHSHGLGVCFPKSSKAAINFKNELSLDLEKIFNVFSIIGDDIYYNLNGRYSLPKSHPLSLDQLENILKQIKTDTPLDIPGLDFKIDYSLPKPIETLAGGGMVGIRKPSAIAPTGGPMAQGLRSLYNNGRKW